jgi:hypothetical protein
MIHEAWNLVDGWPSCRIWVKKEWILQAYEGVRSQFAIFAQEYRMSLTGGTRTPVLEAPNDERANWRSSMFSQKKKILLCQDSILSFWLRHKLWLSKPFTWYLKYTVLSGRIFPVTMYKRKNNISTSRRRKPERLDFLLCIASCTAGSCHAESYL